MILFFFNCRMKSHWFDLPSQHLMLVKMSHWKIGEIFLKHVSRALSMSITIVLRTLWMRKNSYNQTKQVGQTTCLVWLCFLVEFVAKFLSKEQSEAKWYSALFVFVLYMTWEQEILTLCGMNTLLTGGKHFCTPRVVVGVEFVIRLSA